MTPDSVDAAVFSARLKMQDGRKKERKKKTNETEFQHRAKLKKRTKIVAEWNKQDFRGCTEGISRGCGE